MNNGIYADVETGTIRVRRGDTIIEAQCASGQEAEALRSILCGFIGEGYLSGIEAGPALSPAEALPVAEARHELNAAMSEQPSGTRRQAAAVEALIDAKIREAAK